MALSVLAVLAYPGSKVTYPASLRRDRMSSPTSPMVDGTTCKRVTRRRRFAAPAWSPSSRSFHRRGAASQGAASVATAPGGGAGRRRGRITHGHRSHSRRATATGLVTAFPSPSSCRPSARAAATPPSQRGGEAEPADKLVTCRPEGGRVLLDLKGRSRIAPILDPIAATLSRARLTPTMVTGAGLAVTIAGVGSHRRAAVHARGDRRRRRLRARRPRRPAGPPPGQGLDPGGVRRHHRRPVRRDRGLVRASPSACAIRRRR